MNQSTTQTTLEIDTQIYRLSAIKKAAYRLGACCNIKLEAQSDQKIKATLQLSHPSNSLQEVISQFHKELLDQELREMISAETQSLRNLIIAQAYSQTNLLDPQGEAGDFQNDPLNIAPADGAKTAKPDQSDLEQGGQ